MSIAFGSKKVTKDPQRDLKKRGFLYNLIKYHELYIMLIPAVIFFIIFKYLPMGGIVVAFQDYLPWNGFESFITSEWVGLKHFHDLFFRHNNFSQILRNSLTISLLKLIIGFPVPIILALLLNEVKVSWFKRTVQTVTYLPHFLSWVIIYGLMYNLLNPNYGTINEILKYFGYPIRGFLYEPQYFLFIIISTFLWQSVGFRTIIYLAALTGIDPQLYEAANIDGAGHWKSMIHITIPGLMPTCVMMFTLAIGGIIGNDFQQILMFGDSPLLRQQSRVFEVYAYDVGLRQMNFSFGTAIGLFQSVIGFIFVLPTNSFARKLGYRGLF